MQLLGCNSEKEVATSNVDARPTVEQQQAAGELEARKQLTAAQTLLEQGNADQAWGLVNQVLLVTPTNVNALRLAVGIKQQQGEFSEAAELAIQVAESDPSSASMMLLAAFQCHLRCQDFVQAEADLFRAVSVSPNDAQIHRLLAQFLNAQGRRIEASRHVRQLIRMKNIQHTEVLSLIDLRGPFRFCHLTTIPAMLHCHCSVLGISGISIRLPNQSQRNC